MTAQQTPGATGGRKRGLCLLCCCFLYLVYPVSVRPQEADPRFDLTEMEVLKGDNIALRYELLGKELQLIQEQARKIIAERTELAAKLQELEAAVLKARAASAEDYRVNWPAKRVEKKPSAPLAKDAPQE